MAANVFEPIQSWQAAYERYVHEHNLRPRREKHMWGPSRSRSYMTMPLAGKTWLCKENEQGSDFIIRFYDAELIAYHQDGVITIDPQGKLVMTALERLKRYLCSQGISQFRGWWCVNHVNVWWRGTGPSGYRDVNPLSPSRDTVRINTWETRPYHLMPMAVSAILSMPESGMQLLTSNVRGLVETMVEGEDYRPLPILADALEEAGLNDPATLAVLRSGLYADGPNELVARLHAAAKYNGNLSKVFLTRKAVAK
jgi:hypothetical protein